MMRMEKYKQLWYRFCKELGVPFKPYGTNIHPKIIPINWVSRSRHSFSDKWWEVMPIVLAQDCGKFLESIGCQPLGDEGLNYLARQIRNNFMFYTMSKIANQNGILIYREEIERKLKEYLLYDEKR